MAEFKKLFRHNLPTLFKYSKVQQQRTVLPQLLPHPNSTPLTPNSLQHRQSLIEQQDLERLQLRKKDAREVRHRIKHNLHLPLTITSHPHIHRLAPRQKPLTLHNPNLSLQPSPTSHVNGTTYRRHQRSSHLPNLNWSKKQRFSNLLAKLKKHQTTDDQRPYAPPKKRPQNLLPQPQR